MIDDGPGIDPAALSKLVARRARADEARTRAPEGQGLGLHIAYRAAELHGFRLTLRPSEHGGLEVELEGAHARAPEEPPGPAPASGPVRAARAARCPDTTTVFLVLVGGRRITGDVDVAVKAVPRAADEAERP